MWYLLGFAAISAVVLFWAWCDIAHSPLGKDDEREPD
jgi:hypothetical protein